MFEKVTLPELQEETEISNVLSAPFIVPANDIASTGWVYPSNKVESNNELSKIEINSDGIVNKRYSLLNEFASRVIEINQSEVVVEMITDIEHKLIETRHFNKGLFEGLADLRQGRLIIIQILQGHLEQIIKIMSDVNDRVSQNDFDFQTPENILDGLDFSEFNKY
jgi:predicted KAP-like P-loop ATPase